jgi:hypothetical protein
MMQKQRLLKLAQFLRTSVASHQLKMGTWAEKDKNASCLTAGCALGWATVCFPRSKLKLILDWNLVYKRVYHIEYNGQDGIKAAMKFFDLHKGQALNIFYPPNYDCWPRRVITTDMVADRIESLVKDAGGSRAKATAPKAG